MFEINTPLNNMKTSLSLTYWFISVIEEAIPLGNLRPYKRDMYTFLFFFFNAEGLTSIYLPYYLITPALKDGVGKIKKTNLYQIKPRRCKENNFILS